MTFPIDFWMHPKVAPLPVEAKWAFVEMNGYSRMQDLDGRIPEVMALRMWSKAVLDPLLMSDPERPLVIHDGAEFVIRDYAEHQDTKAAREHRVETNKANGSRGGRPRKNPTETDSVSKQNPKVTQPKAEIETETETDKRKNSSSPAARVRVSDEDFERAWAYWPKKVERKKSLEKFKTAAKSRGVEKLIDDIIRFGTAYATTTEKRYVPALNVWLNGERWTDEPPTAGTNVINAQWDALMRETRDPCANGHKWAADNSCVRCLKRKEELE
ncbi:hypothetical protein [Microbacterium sp. LWH11-1.2]|uniref:hypothetical protein n=1 Tax=Microbacterium sp. LWH11-1.2 TaxID=3135258 RepID=UPI003139C3C1